MHDYATKQDVQEIVDRAIARAVTTDIQKIVDTAIARAVADLTEVIANFAEHVDARFNRLEAKIAEHDKKIERLIVAVDGITHWIGRNETGQLPEQAQAATG